MLFEDKALGFKCFRHLHSILSRDENVIGKVGGDEEYGTVVEDVSVMIVNLHSRQMGLVSAHTFQRMPAG